MFTVNQVIAHRGASAYRPENTLVAFEHAVALGCRFVEFDVMLNADGQAFVFHDDTVDRVTNGSGLFANLSSKAVQALDAGSWFDKQYQGQKIMAFEALLKWLIANDVQANIEVKPLSNNVEATTKTVLSILDDCWPDDRPWPLVSSFNLSALRLCRTIMPQLPLGLLLHSWQKNGLEVAKELNCFSVHLNKWILTSRRIARIKDNGHAVCVYTVNSRWLAKSLFRLGVDAVFSDYPDLLLR